MNILNANQHQINIQTHFFFSSFLRFLQLFFANVNQWKTPSPCHKNSRFPQYRGSHKIPPQTLYVECFRKKNFNNNKADKFSLCIFWAFSRVQRLPRNVSVGQAAVRLFAYLKWPRRAFVQECSKQPVSRSLTSQSASGLNDLALNRECIFCNWKRKMITVCQHELSKQANAVQVGGVL